MYNINKFKKETVKIQNNLSTFIIMSLTLIIGISYIYNLFRVLRIEELQHLDVECFIRVFNLILAGLAIGSCIMCYTSTKKEELFIISLMYVVFFIDISIGNLDNMSLTNSTKYVDGYITICTSLLRISILAISIIPFKKIKGIIMSNKISSMLIVAMISIFIGTLESKVAEVRTLPANFNIGYSNIYLTKKETKVAIIPVGHSDGFNVSSRQDMFRKVDKLRYILNDIKGFFKKQYLKVNINNKNYKLAGRLGMYHSTVIVDDNVKVGDKAIYEVNPIYIDPRIRREYK